MAQTRCGGSGAFEGESIKARHITAWYENCETDAFDNLLGRDVVTYGVLALLAETFTEAGNALNRAH